MAELGQIAEKVRSKNAGPFWLTIDIFCGAKDVYDHIRRHLDNAEVARALGAEVTALKRFDIDRLHVIKLSVPRPEAQGTPADRDMHGAQWGHILAEMEMPSPEEAAHGSPVT